jgi:hypothetical protein
MFVPSELIVEQIIRTELDLLRNNMEVGMVDIFGSVYNALLNDKYGTELFDNIKEVIINDKFAIAHAFPEIGELNLPSISIHLQQQSEDIPHTFMGDMSLREVTTIDHPVIIDTFNPLSYDPVLGYVHVADGINLSDVYQNRVFVDGDGAEHTIVWPVDNTTGSKKFGIEKGLTSINLTGCKIISVINSTIYQALEIPIAETLLIGIHSDNSLKTKLLYYVLRYLLYKGKKRLMQYGIDLPKVDATEFHQSSQLLPDGIFSRFAILSFITYNSWRDETVAQVDNLVLTPTYEQNS